MGDLRENAEYHAALDRQGFVKARIGQLRQRIAQLDTVNFSQIPKDRVGIWSTVALLDLDSDTELTYELVLPEVADQTKGLISTSSPIGRGLIGKKEGDQVTIIIPAGQKRFEILGLSTLHDKENRK
jgi:transcription elongation factor GreA